jgi:hypothetical protein
MRRREGKVRLIEFYPDQLAIIAPIFSNNTPDRGNNRAIASNGAKPEEGFAVGIR